MPPRGGVLCCPQVPVFQGKPLAWRFRFFVQNGYKVAEKSVPPFLAQLPGALRTFGTPSRRIGPSNHSQRASQEGKRALGANVRKVHNHRYSSHIAPALEWQVG